MSDVINVFKGTDKDLKCCDYQYKLGKTETDDGAVRCGNEGFHSCEAPFDVLRYYPMRDGNRYFSATAGGMIDRTNADDSKLASSELTLKAEIGIPGLVKAQLAYTRKKAESGTKGGYSSNLAGGDRSNIAGGYSSNIAGGYRSNLAGGYRSNIAGGYSSNIAGGDSSNLAGGYSSNLAGGDSSNLAGGDSSNLAGGDRSNIAGGDRSNIAGGYSSLLVGRNGCTAKAKKNSVIVLTEWKWIDGEYTPICVKAEIVDGVRIKEDVSYTLKDGEFVECE